MAILQRQMLNITGDVKLTDEQAMELQAQIGIYYNHAIGYHQGELGVKARAAWEYYYGHLPEPVTQGSSKWVDRTVMECVNGTLQELISVFTSDEDAVRFAPMLRGDGPSARGATKLVNKVILRDNPGYNVLHDVFKECLVTGNSFVKRYWVEDVKVQTEEFEDLTQEELDIYMSQIDGDIIEMSTEQNKDETFSGRIVYEKKYDGVRFEFVPFEQLCIEPTATSLHDCNYVCHRVRKTKDDLYNLGFDPETVKGLNPSSSDIEAGVIGNARINNLSPINVSDTLSVGDEFGDKVWLHENYLRTSCIDGKFQLYQVFTVNNQILEVNVVNDFPFENFSPFPIPGTIWGESIYDMVKDIQDLKTALVRGVIDNIQNANFRRYQAIKGQYDRQSLLNNRPGAVIEVAQINAVAPFEHHQLPQGVNDLIMYIEGKAEERTGVSKINQGLDPAVFHNDNAFATVNQMLNQSLNRLRMVARNIAHRGMIPLMKNVYDLVRMNAKEYVTIDTPQGPQQLDPRLLPHRTDMIVSVAIGTAERNQRAQSLQTAMTMFNQVPQMTAMFQQQNAYNAGVQMLEAMGIFDVDNFVTPLDQIPPPEPSPMEQLQMQMAQEQIKETQAKTQKIVADSMQAAQEFEFNQFKAADETDSRKQETMSKADLAVEQLRLDERKVAIEEAKLRLKEWELKLKEREIMIEAQIETQQGRAVGLGRS
ncbi:MAG: portal protein [Bacteroidales bacterium]